MVSVLTAIYDCLLPTPPRFLYLGKLCLVRVTTSCGGLCRVIWLQQIGTLVAVLCIWQMSICVGSCIEVRMQNGFIGNIAGVI